MMDGLIIFEFTERRNAKIGFILGSLELVRNLTTALAQYGVTKPS